MLPPDSDDTERPTCAKRSRERLNTLKVFALAALSWTASSLWSALHGCGQFVGGTVANNRDFLVGTAGAVFTYLQFDEAYRASDDYKIQTAVKTFLQPYEMSDPEAPVVKRHVMQTIKANITAWSRQTKKTTIVTGRYQAGKTVAVNEALRGVRGVLQVSVRDAGWEEKMYKELGVGHYGMFKQVLRRVAVELQKMPDNPTNYPILLLEVPRQSPVGALRAFCRLARSVNGRLTRFKQF